MPSAHALVSAPYLRTVVTGGVHAIQAAACQMDYSRWIGNMDINIAADPEPDWWMGGPLDAPDYIPTGAVRTAYPLRGRDSTQYVRR